MNRIILQGGKSASFPLVRSFSQLNGNSKGFEKKKILEGRGEAGFSDFGIWRPWGGE